jgi:hypothetical protein
LRTAAPSKYPKLETRVPKDEKQFSSYCSDKVPRNIAYLRRKRANAGFIARRLFAAKHITPNFNTQLMRFRVLYYSGLFTRLKQP